MSLRNTVASLFVFSMFLLFGVSANAQGIIIPRPCDIAPRCPRPIPRPQPLPVSLPVKSIVLDTKINGQVATTRVEQVFENNTPYTFEGTYFFPIPENASIEQFSIWENGKRLSGEVRSREEARRIYNEIVRSMRDPGLLEYAGKDLFQASIFPIPANSEKKLELTYTQVLKADSGTVSFHYPLGTGSAVWAGRPAPSETRRVNQSFGSVSGKLEITSVVPLRNIYSPSHSLEVNRKGQNSAVITFETKGKPDDFRLYFTLSDKDLGLSLVTYREPGKDGYFLMTIAPNDEALVKNVVNKDIVFVLDTSGSMQDDGKLTKARPALLFGIRSLNDGDRFNVINFSGEEHLMESELVSASKENKRKSEDFINGLKPNGGTNINDALTAALEQFDGSERPKMLVLLTDGLPTVGEQDVDKIIDNVKKKGVGGVRLFPFGVGYDVNTRLLDKLGSENSGIADYVEPKEDLEIKVSNFFSKVSSPVLSDLHLDYGNVTTELMYPRKLTDLFRGSQMVIVGKYTNRDDVRSATVRLDGKTNKETRTFRYDNLAFPLRNSENEFLPRLWASRRVGWLIEQIRTNGESKELKDEIVDLGTRYGIVTPYTSYLATDGSFRARETSGNRFQIDGAAGAAISGQMREEQGRDAVKRSVQQNQLQMNAIATSSADADASTQVFLRDSSSNQFVGTKNFISDGGVWIDTRFKADEKLTEVRVRFGTDEYFELAFSDPELSRYLSLGKNIVIVWNGQVYRISE